MAARACELAVFGRRYGNTAAQLRAEYGPYEGTTSFGAVLSPDGRAAGAVRLLHGAPSELKTLRDAAGPPWDLPVGLACFTAGIDLDTTWDVATFGVDAEAAGGRNRTVTHALFAVMFSAFRDNGVTAFVAVLDAGARRPIAALGVETTDLPGTSPAPYLGSPASVPVYARLADLHVAHTRRFPRLHDQVFHGQGIDGVDQRSLQPGKLRLKTEGLAGGTRARAAGGQGR